MTGPADKRHAPSALRNREPILAVLRRILPQPGTVLEIASGTGEHATYLAAQLPHITWQPSDLDGEMLASILAWAADADAPNLNAPIVIDAAADDWSLPADLSVDAIVNINMIHITPFSACEGLLAGAGRYLRTGRILYLYGPYKLGGLHTAPSNAAFDRSLRAENSAWGVLDLDDIIGLADASGLDHIETIRMPVNNLSVIFRRR